MSALVGTWFTWLLRASWQASILVLLVLVVQSTLQKGLSARWRYALWLLVLARLALPLSWHSPFSVFNYARFENVAAAPARPVAASQVSRPTPDAPPSTPQLETPDALPTAATPVLEPAASPSFTLSVPAPVPATKPRLTAKIAGLCRKENLLSFCALLWAAGVAFLALRIIAQNLAFLGRLRADNLVSDPGIVRLFETCKARFSITFPIRLVESNAVSSPALYGFFRPILLLPASLITGFSARELRHVFLHELAHVKRRDMAVHWAATALQVLHWFNPVLWLAFRRMAADRELACDELALSYAEDRESRSYGETIIQLLESCSRPAALPGLMGILEDKSQITRRISMIARFRKQSHWPVLAISILIVLGLVSLTDAEIPKKSSAIGLLKESAGKLAPSPAPSSVSDENDNQATGFSIPFASAAGVMNPPKGPGLHFRAIEAGTRKALENAAVTVLKCNDEGSWAEEKYSTDSKGRCLVELGSATLTGIVLNVNKEGHPPKSIQWSASDHAPVPADYTTTLEPGVTIGGVVRNQDGKPISGAMVLINGSGADVAPKTRESLALWNITVKTDANGRWLFPGLPQDLDAFGVALEHPDYAPSLYACDTRTDNPVGSSRLSLQSLLATNCAMELKPGRTLAGIVADKKGQPIPGARVLLGVSVNSRAATITKTDAQGMFQFQNPPAGQNCLTVQAQGFAPDLKPVVVGANHALVRFQLDRGRVFKGVVVDEAGQPIPGAGLTVGSWRKRQTLQWSAKTDARGRFEWSSAPNDTNEPPIGYVGKLGYAQLRLINFVPSNPQTFVLKREVAFSGNVIDRLTRQPLDDFTVTPGKYQGNGQVDWETSGSIRGSAGKYFIDLGEPGGSWVLKIEAAKYLPILSELLKSGAASVDFELDEDAGPREIAMASETQPPAGTGTGVAQQAMAAPVNYILLNNPIITATKTQDPASKTNTSAPRWIVPIQHSPFSPATNQIASRLH